MGSTRQDNDQDCICKNETPGREDIAFADAIGPIAEVLLLGARMFAGEPHVQLGCMRVDVLANISDFGPTIDILSVF